jgi:catechol 2,3-dioxygenase-like lactoylglutathione lyase family enzyme
MVGLEAGGAENLTMKLNQVTLPAKNLAASIDFYEGLSFVLIVRNDHYARLENPEDGSTLSLELRQDGGDGAHLYFECEDLDARVAALAAEGITFEGPEDKSWLWREAWTRDPAGNRLCLYRAGENRRYPPWRLG